jgi:hypothetical protein
LCSRYHDVFEFLVRRADLKHVSDTIQWYVERCFACVMDYGLCIGTMRSFAAAKTSGPALRIGTGSTNEKKTGISVDAVSSLIYSTSQYKFIATYVGYSFQAQGVRKNQSFFFVFFSSSSSHPVFYSP